METPTTQTPTTPNPTDGGTELPVTANGNSTTETAKKSPAVSELARAVREKRALETKLAELSKTPAVTKDQVVAELKRRYEEDPEAFLTEVAGEDFYALAERIAKKTPAEVTVETVAGKLAALEREREEERKAKDAERSAEADKRTAAHIAELATIVEETNDDGTPKYPTLATLDDSALEEPVAVTAYTAVAYAAEQERQAAEKRGEKWTMWKPDEVKARFAGAFKALEDHYAKLRTPKSKAPKSQEPNDPESGEGIQNHTSGSVDPPARGTAPGTMTVQQALRAALKEHGLD